MDAELMDRAITAKIIVMPDLHMVPKGDEIFTIAPSTRLQKAIEATNHHHTDDHGLSPTERT